MTKPCELLMAGRKGISLSRDCDRHAAHRYASRIHICRATPIRKRVLNWIMPAVAAALSIFTHTASAQQLEKAIFAGGCFWCVESDFDKVPGVVATISGYTGGKTENPTYKQVSSGGTGLSLPFISSAVETLEFCIPTGYLFRHAQDHQHAHLRLPRNRPWPRSALHRNPCPATAGSCPETEKAPAIASEGG